jgi:hypothetical protein
MTASPIEPKRIKKFRLSLAKGIPRFPNDKASLKVLEAKHLTDILVDYINWMVRYVAPRPRTVHVELSASNDPRWTSQSSQIAAFLEKVKKGDELTPHLSLKPHTRGVAPAASRKGPGVDRWADKDMVLNVMGYHHFHLGKTIGTSGHATRTDEVLFAQVTRDRFEVVAIFDHTVFDMRKSPTEPLSAERNRLWQIYDERTTRGAPSGSVVVASSIATSGHSVNFVRQAINYTRILYEIDPKLDDPVYVRGLYRKATPPEKPRLEWRMHFLDLCLFCRAAQCALIFKKGPN